MAPSLSGGELALRRSGGAIRAEDPSSTAAPTTRSVSPALSSLPADLARAEAIEFPPRPVGLGASPPLIRVLEESGSHLLYVGMLAQVSVILLPLTLLLQSSRIFGILGFVATSFFLPFAPIAWFAGQNHELRLRSRGVEPSPRVQRAKKLGILATTLLAGELVIVGVLIATLRLSGRMPESFGITR